MSETLKLKQIPDDMKVRICRAMSQTWQQIGDDILNCSIEYGSGKTIPRSEVIEVVCDADRMQMFGGDQEAYLMTKKMTYADLKKLGKVAFPYARYGW